jgi:GT2 family glycosyltransferase
MPDPLSANLSRQPSVAVVILSYNSKKWLERCIQSVLNTDWSCTTAVFVDNGSHDGSFEFVQSRFPAVRCIQTGTNLGFAGGNNVGILHALQDGHDYVLLLNADAWMERDCLGELVAVMEAEPMLGFFSALILGYDDQRLDKNWMQFMRESYRCLQDLWNGTLQPWYETNSGSGAALLMRSSMLRQIGLIDPVFFMYFEEIDLIRRGRYHRWRSGFSTKAIVHHYNHLESSGPGHSSGIRFERGHMIYTLKNQEEPAIKCVLAFLLESVGRVAGAVLKRQWGRAGKLLRAALELYLKAPWILWRRHLEMRDPSHLEDLATLRGNGGMH